MKKTKQVSIGLQFFDAINKNDFNAIDESQYDTLRHYLMMNSGDHVPLLDTTQVDTCAVTGEVCLTLRYNYKVPSLTETALNYDEL